MALDRRALLAGMAAAAAAPQDAGADAEPPPVFASGPLAANRVAQHFRATPAKLKAPDPRLLAADGPHRWEELTGRVRIVSLWAEWCPWCRLEAPDLDDWRRRKAGANFDILGVLTGSRDQLDVAGARAALNKSGAPTLPTWIEPHGGDTLFLKLTRNDGSPSLPCNLLVDAKGVIRGRSLGADWADRDATKKLQDLLAGKLGHVAPADREAITTAGSATLWTLPDADAFADALSTGALDQM